MTALGPPTTDSLEHIEPPVLILTIIVLLARFLVHRFRLHHHSLGRLCCPCKSCACHAFLERGGSTDRPAFPLLLLQALLLLLLVVFRGLHRGRNAGTVFRNAPFLQGRLPSRVEPEGRKAALLLLSVLLLLLEKGRSHGCRRGDCLRGGMRQGRQDKGLHECGGVAAGEEQGDSGIRGRPHDDTFPCAFLRWRLALELGLSSRSARQ